MTWLCVTCAGDGEQDGLATVMGSNILHRYWPPVTFVCLTMLEPNILHNNRTDSDVCDVCMTFVCVTCAGDGEQDGLQEPGYSAGTQLSAP